MFAQALDYKFSEDLGVRELAAAALVLEGGEEKYSLRLL
jgi:hypothetical protein